MYDCVNNYSTFGLVLRRIYPKHFIPRFCSVFVPFIEPGNRMAL